MTTLKRGDELELTIETLAFGGEGIGKYNLDGKLFTVFVEDTVPGDQVKVRLGTVKKNYAFGYVEKLIVPSTLRISPRCQHFSKCGGCSLQFLDYNQQLKLKGQHVRDAISRIGGLSKSLVQEIIGCQEPWYYRNKMEFSFSRELVKKGDEMVPGRLGLGLHVRRRHHDMIELTECFLLGDYVGALVTQVRDFVRGQDDKGLLEGAGRLTSLVLREGKNSGEVMINLIAENFEPIFLPEFTGLICKFFAAGLKTESNEKPVQLKSIYFTRINNIKGRPKSIQEKVLWGEKVIYDYLQVADGTRLRFALSPQAFFQPNTSQAEILYSRALEAAELNKKEIVYDLFCGAGTIGCFSAHLAKHVYGIELNESAIMNAGRNARLNGLNNITFMAGDVAKKLPEIREKPDTVIVDPPRSGLSSEASDLIIQLRPAKLVYVSCNPTTLARDLALFTARGYRLESVQPVDMFPQTYHIECVAKLVLAAR